MTNSFTLGKDGNLGNIDFNKLRSGITKKDLGIEDDTVLSNIFDSIDNAEDGENKGNGKLERNELLAFINKIRELAGKDSNVSTNETKNYEINGEKLGKNNEDLLTFVSKLAELTKGVKNVSINSGAEIITYEDGHTEQIFADGSKIITVKNGNKTTIAKKNSDESLKLQDKRTYRQFFMMNVIHSWGFQLTIKKSENSTKCLLNKELIPKLKSLI